MNDTILLEICQVKKTPIPKVEANTILTMASNLHGVLFLQPDQEHLLK